MKFWKCYPVIVRTNAIAEEVLNSKLVEITIVFKNRKRTARFQLFPRTTIGGEQVIEWMCIESPNYKHIEDLEVTGYFINYSNDRFRNLEKPIWVEFYS